MTGHELESSRLVLVALGLVVGLLGGTFGVGGSFIAGPALFLLGMPFNAVVGTDLAHIAGKSLAAARHHHARGHVDRRLAALLVPTTVAGVELGARVLEHMRRSGESALLATLYAALLAFLGVFVLVESWRAHSREKEPPAALRHVSLGPDMHFPVSRVRGSILAVCGIGLVSGFLGGIFGGGLGFLRMPALVYLLGIPTRVAIGTDLLEVIVSSGYGAFTHALKGNVDFGVALTMQAGGVLGSRFGARVTAHVRESTLRVAFAPLPLLGAALVVYRLMSGTAQP